MSKPPPKIALEELRLDLDLRIDDGVASWVEPTPALTVAFDPQHPAEALPAGYVERRLHPQPNWMALQVVTVIGLPLWLLGMGLLLGGVPRILALPLAMLPLVLLPWWAEKGGW